MPVFAKIETVPVVVIVPPVIPLPVATDVTVPPELSSAAQYVAVPFECNTCPAVPKEPFEDNPTDPNTTFPVNVVIPENTRLPERVLESVFCTYDAAAVPPRKEALFDDIVPTYVALTNTPVAFATIPVLALTKVPVLLATMPLLARTLIPEALTTTPAPATAANVPVVVIVPPVIPLPVATDVTVPPPASSAAQ